MPELPAEAVQAAARANSEHYEVCGERDCGRCTMIYNAARRGLDAALRVMEGVGSPVSCPSAAPESTHSPETTSAAPVYRSGVERPTETLSAPRGCDGSDDPRHRCGRHHPTGLASVGGYLCCCGEPWLGRRGHCATGEKAGAVVTLRARLRAVIHYAALEGDEALDQVDGLADAVLSRALRIADYHADLHRQAEAAIARVHQVCRQALATPDAPDRWAVAAQVRAALEGPEPQVGAGAVSEEQTEPVRHLGGNAEDCQACDITTLPYPFLCPGEEQTGGGNG